MASSSDSSNLGARPASPAEGTALAPDSARAILEWLASDRGTPMLSEEDYQKMRGEVLLELAQGPRVRVFTLITFGAVGLIFVCFLVIGLVTRSEGDPLEWVLPIASGACLVIWARLLRGHLADIRQQSRVSILARLAEIEDLRRGQLINQAEFERLYAAIHSTRETSKDPKSEIQS